MRLEQVLRSHPYGVSQVIEGDIKPLIVPALQIIEVPSTPIGGVTISQVDERIDAEDYRDLPIV